MARSLAASSIIGGDALHDLEWVVPGPIDSWLRGPLRDWAETLLAPKRLAADGLLRVEPVRHAWAQHLAGTRNWQYPLWTLLMLQAWRERWA
jgi:asparagine synthase (glutamine-hydrolysing)